jgi:hypothetical protein
MDIPETRSAWQCIGCGKLEGPQRCIGVCQDRRVELVDAQDYLRLWEQHQTALGLLRRLALVRPRAGFHEAAWTTLQQDARRLFTTAQSDR